MLSRAAPIPALRDYVRCYEQRLSIVAGAPVVFPLAARPYQFLEFYLGDRNRTRATEGAEDIAPRAVIVGPFAGRRIDLVLRGRFDVFTIHFQPSGLHRLFRASMAEFADHAHDARSALGPMVAEIEEQIAGARGFPERVSAANAFLARRLEHASPNDAIASIANRLFSEHGALRVDNAAKAAGLSIRQFERRFLENVGLSPKQYARIVRFNDALEAKLAEPKRLWTDIAHACGYFDQMHLIHDFACFASESPTAFMRRFESLPQPWE
jgi:AraC-like DNA-binding protein